MGTFCQKKPNSQFDLKFEVFEQKYCSCANLFQKIEIVTLRYFFTQTHSGMKKSMVVFTLSALDRKYPVEANLILKCKTTCSLGYLQEGKSNRDVLLCAFDQKYAFWANLLKNTKIVLASLNFASKLDRIYKT